MYVKNLLARNLCLDLKRQVFIKQCDCNRTHCNCVDTLHTCMGRTYNYGDTGCGDNGQFSQKYSDARAQFRQPVDGTVSPPDGWTGLSVVFIATVW